MEEEPVDNDGIRDGFFGVTNLHDALDTTTRCIVTSSSSVSMHPQRVVAFYCVRLCCGLVTVNVREACDIRLNVL